MKSAPEHISGSTMLDRIKLLLIRFGFEVRRHSRSQIWKLFFLPCKRVTLASSGGTVALQFADFRDHKVFREVFMTEEYRVIDPGETILDLGAHVGYTTAYFYLSFPQATIHSVEPNPLAFTRLRAMAEGKGRIHTYQCAVVAKNGPVVLHLSDALVYSSIFPREGDTGTVEVLGRTLTDLFIEIGVPSLMKIDIEGGEEYVLADPVASKVRTIIGELHEDITDVSKELLLKPLAGYTVTTNKIGEGRYSFKAQKE